MDHVHRLFIYSHPYSVHFVPGCSFTQDIRQNVGLLHVWSKRRPGGAGLVENLLLNVIQFIRHRREEKAVGDRKLREEIVCNIC